MKKMKKTSLGYYIIELLVVFIGVTAGFLLNTWRQENSEIKLERKYLTSFYSDIVSDETSLDSLVFHSQTKTDKLLVILRETGLKNRPLDEELAQSIVNEILYIEWFSASNDTYEDIINSGNLNLVSDYSLKEKISSYYNLLDEVNNVEEFYKDHMNNYGLPILYKNYHLLNHKFINKESYQSLEFTNMYLGVTALFQQNNKIYREALQKNRELKSELAEALKLKE